MYERMELWGRIGAAIVAAALLLALDVSAALAQSGSCDQLNASLQSIERNRDFRNANQVNADARAATANERNAENAYLRTGCQRDQDRGLPQTPQCRAIARQILDGRALLAQLAQSANTGNSIAQQRQQIVRQMDSLGCNSGSQARFSGFNAQPRRRNFLQDLFGNFGGNTGNDSPDYYGPDQVQEPSYGPQGDTIRTVCVRMSDGYYWPVSYSTLPDYIPQDAAQCQSECPGQEVDLFYYANPGQEPEQMINAEGKAYSSLPNAFAYRKQVDPNNACKQPQNIGQISLDDLGNGQKRPVLTINDRKLPLPLRDPRAAPASAHPAKYAQIIDIPLPRRRPPPEGTVVAPTAEPVVSAKSRTVKVGDKIVRIVGPDTPYAPSTAAGT
jgi:hypothetical protein